ncbi:MAG: hypothetical protein HY420_02390, partial [Candidatus Kerfeldbacteria bacterium]|nr:hypothetical protein [Candidatus Kerfeldbacteria bacterium]
MKQLVSPHYYRQEKGLLHRPLNKPKWHISWSLDNILEGFKEFFRVNNRWPVASDLVICDYLPNVKTLERKFGGIVKIREKLGLENAHFNKGQWRSERSKLLWKRGYFAEQSLSSLLIEYFGEPFVHNQARVVINENQWVKVDFLIYHKTGKFAVDVFFPTNDRQHFSSNVSAKYRTYKDFIFTIFLVVGNNAITSEFIKENIDSALHERNKKVKLISLNDFLKEVGKYEP